MEIISPAVESVEVVTSPLAYRRLYGRSLMVLQKTRSESPSDDELCHITSVNTLAPGLWVTAKFLDGSTQSFRPEKIRLADAAAPSPAEPN